MATYHVSPIGEFRHPWINKPDTKYNDQGLYHTDLILSGDAAEALAKKIDQAAQAAFAEHTQEMKPGDVKKWSVYVPYERLEDDQGEPTGEIAFAFKQNAKIASKKEPSGFKDVTIPIHDSQDNVLSDVAIWDGSKGRIMFSMRPISMSQSKQSGVRLDFAKVQITFLKKGGGGKGRGFGVVEDGFVADVEDKGFGSAPEGGASDDQGGDY